MSELKPCPKCRSAADIGNVGRHRVVALCLSCGLRTREQRTCDAARADWNTRAPDPTLAQQQEEIGRLRSALEPVLKAIDASDWHDVNGERMKRVLVAQTAIDRTRAALESRHAD